ncbi:hypothetical protein MTO96_011814 [Rhipicephalus appendiculatus]
MKNDGRTHMPPGAAPQVTKLGAPAISGGCVEAHQLSPAPRLRQEEGLLSPGHNSFRRERDNAHKARAFLGALQERGVLLLGTACF